MHQLRVPQLKELLSLGTTPTAAPKAPALATAAPTAVAALAPVTFKSRSELLQPQVSLLSEAPPESTSEAPDSSAAPEDSPLSTFVRGVEKQGRYGITGQPRTPVLNLQ